MQITWYILQRQPLNGRESRVFYKIEVSVHIPPLQKVIGNSRRKGFSNARLFKQKYESKINKNFQSDGGVQAKRTFLGRGIDIDDKL